MLYLLAPKNRFFRGSVAVIAIFGLFLPLSLPQYAITTTMGELQVHFIDWGLDENIAASKTAEESPFWETDKDFFAGIGLVGENALIKANPPLAKETTRKMKIIVTAYSSTPDQTDDTPFITASGTRTRDGVTANNSLSFGTRVKFPQIFGDKIFVIEDRMAPKNSHKADIWMPTRQMALNFGVKYTEMEIL